MNTDSSYYAVIFSSQRCAGDDEGYEAMAAKMAELAAGQPGYLGMESVRTADGAGITVSYWESLDAIAAWKAHETHRAAQILGKDAWYRRYRIRIARVEREYEWIADAE